jgi:HTH-type transcriptional regulator/antitoxin HigA
LRHDRLDNFWFTLCHELAHVALHLDRDCVDAFFDDLTEEGTSQCEKEANEMAREALIPKKVWEKSGLKEYSDTAAVRTFASELRIHPAIPAGRIRFENHDYHLLNELVGNKQVRCLFGL